MVTYLLDNGVRGIMVPQVEQVETVLRMSAHVRYRDGRSLGSTTRAAKFGNVPKPEYGEWVDEALALLPMVETAAGLEIVDDLARLDEVTAITIGPGDLAASLDTEFGSEAHQKAIDDVFAAAEAHDCPVGIFVGSETDLDQYRDRAAFVVYGSDIGLLAAEYQRVLGA